MCIKIDPKYEVITKRKHFIKEFMWYLCHVPFTHMMSLTNAFCSCCCYYMLILFADHFIVKFEYLYLMDTLFGQQLAIEQKMHNI